MSRARLALLLTLAIAATALLAPASGSAACRPVTVSWTSSGYELSYTIYGFRLRNVSCKTARRLVRQRLRGPSRRGSAPYLRIVDGWEVGMIDRAMWGRRGNRRFDAKYR
jgi:hypothetical protein